MNTRLAVESGPVCPYCDEKVQGGGVQCGSEVMHDGCFAEFGIEMSRIYRGEFDPLAEVEKEQVASLTAACVQFA